MGFLGMWFSGGCGLRFCIVDLGICMLMCSDLVVCIGVVVVWGLDCDGGGFVSPLVAFSFCRCGWSCGCWWSMLFFSSDHVGAVFVWNHGRCCHVRKKSPLKCWHVYSFPFKNLYGAFGRHTFIKRVPIKTPSLFWFWCWASPNYEYSLVRKVSEHDWKCFWHISLNQLY